MGDVSSLVFRPCFTTTAVMDLSQLMDVLLVLKSYNFKEIKVKVTKLKIHNGNINLSEISSTKGLS